MTDNDSSGRVTALIPRWLMNHDVISGFSRVGEVTAHVLRDLWIKTCKQEKQNPSQVMHTPRDTKSEKTRTKGGLFSYFFFNLTITAN